MSARQHIASNDAANVTGQGARSGGSRRSAPSRADVVAVVRSGIAQTESFVAAQVQAIMPAAVLRDAGARPVALPGVSDVPVATGVWAEERVGGRLGRRVPAALRVAAQQYGKALQRVPGTVVHAHFGPAGVLIDLSGDPRPIVTSVYGYDVGVLGRRARWRAAYRALANRGLFVTEGPAMRQELLQLGLPAHRIEVVPLSLPDDTWRLPECEQHARSHYEFAVVARLVEKKGVDLAIEAVGRLAAAGVDARLTIAGAGPLRRELEKQRNQAGAPVEFCGAVDRPGFFRLLQRCDAVLFPSRHAPNGDTEGGAPMALTEAQFLGRATIASRHADLPYQTAPSLRDLLFEEDDLAGLMASLQAFIRGKEEWHQRATAARGWIRRRHDPQRLRSAWLAIYETSRSLT